MEELPTSGEWVQYLQQLLERAGYWNEERTEDYAPTLQEAVRLFQRDHDLASDGELNGPTWAALLVATDTEGHELEIDWENEYPEIYSLATSTDLDQYMRRVVEIDPAVFEDDPR